MAAPIFKFKNVRVIVDEANANKLVYAVDIGRGPNGLDLGVLPEEVSSVILTVQCSNKRAAIPNKTVTTATGSNNRLTVADTSILTANTPVVFSGSVFGGVTSGATYYVKQIINSTEFTISSTLSSGVAGAEFDISDGSGAMTADFSSVRVTASVEDLETGASYDLVKDYIVLPNNAFDPLSGNLVLTSKLALNVKANVANAVDVTVSLLEIANATAT